LRPYQIEVFRIVGVHFWIYRGTTVVLKSRMGAMEFRDSEVLAAGGVDERRWRVALECPPNIRKLSPVFLAFY
jgi:hypothetical protein